MKNRTLKRLIYCFPLFILFITTASFIEEKPVKPDTTESNRFKLKTIVVDAGHGGRRAGAAGSFSLEKDVTLAIAFKLQKAIQRELKDIKVVMTRTNGEDVDWQKRSDIANAAKGNLFISIHCNSLPDKIETVRGKRTRVPDRSGKGVLILVYGFHRTKEEEKAIRENLMDEKDASEMNSAFDPNDPTSTILLNAYKNKYRKQSIRFADLVNKEFVETDGRHSNGVIEQGVLVLCHSAMPSILVETGFINNPDDEKYLNSEEGQEEIVNSIVRAIIKYRKENE
ncbi:N-acetylmuramoyl-L-alanine amidase [uncultured Mucilaginibacter sp.]|uniref:N-acetylmuramoyl-L-alanine amidase family protein n=1 Tax=uncultured Mucilaginibacter sp. TaxID=797541 RepID=UPI0026036525|nr:N-acetylmuramoyl-L-alanine amidase [uncultured Mucilaginibacter sp.]